MKALLNKISLSVGMMAAVFIGAQLGAPATATATTGGRDCDNNAIIRCGSLTTAELKKDYDANAQGDIKTVFNHYGITSADMADISSAHMGEVHKDGRVTINGKTVATGAKTVGRQDINGSTPVTIDGKTFYERTPSVSFRSESIPAIVIMKDGEFHRAVITSCGNPVVANPVVKPAAPAPKPAPAPVKPVEKTPAPAPAPKVEPKYSCDSLTFSEVNRTTYKFVAKASASDGAVIKYYDFDFGDGDSKRVDTSSTKATITHEYTDARSYTVTVIVHFMVDGELQQASGSDCEVVVEVLPEEEIVTPAVEIPKTGPAQLIGAGMGISSLSAAGYYWAQSRRNLTSKFFKG